MNVKKEKETIMEKRIIQGWKHFKCNECALEWQEATRDYNSCSIGDCVSCHSEDVDLVGCAPDKSLSIDNGGNLTQHYIVLKTEDPE